MLIGLVHDLLKDWQLYITKLLDIHTIPGSSMFTQLSQQSRVACCAVHEVNGNLPFSWIKTNTMTVSFAPAVVFVVVGVKPDSAYIPELWCVSADALHHFNQRL